MAVTIETNIVRETGREHRNNGNWEYTSPYKTNGTTPGSSQSHFNLNYIKPDLKKSIWILYNL